MTTKSRIALGIAFLLSVIVVLGALGVFHLQAIEKRNDSVYRSNFKQLTAIESLIRGLNELSTTQLGGDSNALLLEIQKFEKQAEATLRALDVDSTAPSGEYLQRRLSDDIEALLAELYATSTNPKEALNNEASAQLILEINEALHTLFTENETAVSTAFLDNKETTNAAQKQMLILGIICVLFAVGILVWLPSYVTSPLARFSTSVSDIARGNYNTQVDIDRDDEFGRLALSFNSMAARLGELSEQNIAEVISSRNRLSTLLDQLEERILGIDRDRIIVFINPAMEAYLEVEHDSALGVYMPDLALSKPRLQRLFEPMALGESAAIEPFADILPNGEAVYYQERVVRLKGDESGELNGYIIILSDVTDYEERTHRQTDFLATLSHEMKTPIAAIEMCVNLLEDVRLGALDEDQLELTTTVRDNNKRLLRMVNEVLQLSQNEAGKIRLDLDRIDLIDVIKRVNQEVQPLAKDKQLNVITDAGGDVPEIEADDERIGWVMRNLMTNAIRYAPVSSEITIALNKVPGGIRLSVSDQGPGVPPAEQERIFEKYARATGDTTKGTGLGLAISREFVEAHGGRIYVDSSHTAGAMFVLELPRQLPETLRQQHAILAA